MSNFIAVGFAHIVSVDALDHLLFLAALAACYRPRDWRHGLTVATAFTVGHSITLALASLGVIVFNTAVVEFLIPVTIVIAGIENLVQRRDRPGGPVRPILAGAFGLVHGAGFANILRDLFDGGFAMPLLGFNIGIELGQILILGVLITAFTLFDRAVQVWEPEIITATRLRSRIASVAVASVAVVIAAGRTPW
ncbi:MAG: HupE/UreJ family protein [Gemmatimonadales bacterium]